MVTHGADQCLLWPTPNPSGYGKSWSIFPAPAVRNSLVTEGVLVLGKDGRSCRALPWWLWKTVFWVPAFPAWKPPLRAATVSFSSFWDSWAVISTGRFVNPLVLPCVCVVLIANLWLLAFTVMLWATALHCIQQTETHFSAPRLIKVLRQAFVVVGEALTWRGHCSAMLNVFDDDFEIIIIPVSCPHIVLLLTVNSA